MALRIQNNIAALGARRNLDVSQSKLVTSLERLSSGFRINKAADDAAGLAISQGLRGELAGFVMASRNASQASSMLQVAEGALDQVSNILTRLRELATQAASDNVNDRTSIATEADQLVSEIDRIVNSTKYSGQLLIDGSFGETKGGSWTPPDNVTDLSVGSGSTVGAYSVSEGTSGSSLIVTVSTGGVSQALTLSDGAATANFTTFGISFETTSAFDADVDSVISDITVATSGGGATFQIGAENASGSQLSVSIGNASTATIGIDGGSQVSVIDLSTKSGAQSAIDILDAAIDDISNIRGSIGAYQNRLSYASANLSTTIENVTAAESVIRDTDLAFEMTEFTKQQIVQQAGVAMLAQANALPKAVLKLL
jgi:flagellin